jgi:hypothetical protein
MGGLISVFEIQLPTMIEAKNSQIYLFLAFIFAFLSGGCFLYYPADPPYNGAVAEW